jgi:hypothetical protein
MYDLSRTPGLDKLSRDDFAALLKEARDPLTSPERLQQLAPLSYRPSPRSRRLADALGAHPNTPIDCLLSLMSLRPEALLRNPVLPLLPLERPDFPERLGNWTLTILLRFEDVPPFVLQEAKKSGNKKVRRAVRWHIAAVGEADPAGTEWEEQAIKALRRLPETRWERVWEIVEHQAAPIGLLECLGLAAVHPPESYESEQFRKAQAKAHRAQTNPQPPTEFREPASGWKLVSGEDLYLARQAALDTRTSPDTLRSLAAALPRETKLLDYSYSLDKLKEELARNPATPTDALRQLLPAAAATIAAHPNADAALLSEMAASAEKDSLGILSALLGNPNTPSEAAAIAAANLRDIRDAGEQKLGAYERRLLRWHPTLNPNGPTLPEETSEPFQQWLQSYRPRLDSFLWTVGRAYHPHTLSRLARWYEWSRRLAAALNPSTPPNVLRYLSNDGNRFVRAAARARLAEPSRPLLGISYTAE